MSRGFVNPLAPKKSGVIEAARNIKSWTRELMGLKESIAVSVNELACHLPGCPPKETVILIMGEAHSTLQFSIHKAMTDVTCDDLRTAALNEESKNGKQHGSASRE